MDTGSVGRIAVSATARSRAPAEVVFGLLKDGATWPRWSMFDAFELERPGTGDPLGVGAIRVFITRVSKVREEVVEMVDGALLSYVLLSGLPMKDYRADVGLEAMPDGSTLIHWRARFDPKIAGTGWFWRMMMTRVLRTVSQQLAAAAERASVAPHQQTAPDGTVR
jgi:hypothetical protein